MKKTKAMCPGCYSNFYNHGGHKGCWNFAGATVVKRVRVGTWEPPPYSPTRAEQVLSCYRSEGYALLGLNDCRVREKTAKEKVGG